MCCWPSDGCTMTSPESKVRSSTKPFKGKQPQRLRAASALAKYDPCGCIDGSVFRRNGRIAAEVCVVSEEFAGADLACGDFETQRSWVVRHAGECIFLVSGAIPALSPRPGRGARRR